MIDHRQGLLHPARVWSRTEIFSINPCPIPREKGVYAWYFRNFPAIIPGDGCITFQDLTLLYVGIAPQAPPKTGKPPSSQTLYDRISYHYGRPGANAYGSTLRRSLGCLLADELGIQLRLIGNGKRTTFVGGEATLSDWMGRNAFVVWTSHERPWDLETELIRTVSLPLNLEHNTHHPFCPVLKAIRAQAKAKAQRLPIVE